MTSGTVSARDAAREKLRHAKMRAAARARRQTVRVLNCFALGYSIEDIAGRVGIAVLEVRTAIRVARGLGDPRALMTEGERRRSASAWKRPAAGAPAPPPPPPSPPLDPAASRVLRHAIGPGVRADRVAVLRRAAGRAQLAHPHAAAGFLHLADLYSHCDSFYPSLSIPSEGVTEFETRMRFPNARPVAVGGGAALACEMA